MAAFLYRMGAGFPGDVNRTHPASIEACLIDANAPPTAYGQAVLVDATTQGVRPFAAGDHSDAVPVVTWGITVRAFPTQQAQTNQNLGAVAFGSVAPPTNGVIDVMTSGYIMATVPAGQAPVKGGQAYVWAAATSGAHILGGWETSYSSGNTALVANAFFNGSPDASGNVEIRFNN